MAKSLNEFGGWLVWFKVISWFSLIIMAVFAVLSLLSFFGATRGLEAVESIIYAFDLGINAFLLFRIIRLLKINNPQTPNRILKFMSLVLFFSAIFIIPELWLDYLLTGGKKATDVGKAGFQVIIWYSIWTSYFKKSKRVCAYYGKNADKLFPTARENI